MRIEIIGAGAVGLLLGSYFAEQHADVTFIKRSNEQEPHYLNITRTNVDGSSVQLQVESATTINEEAAILFIAVKYGQLQEVYQKLKHVNPSIPIVFLQNGLAHYEEALQLNQRHIAFCSIQFGAQKIAENHVAHKGNGVMKLAVAKGDSSHFDFLKDFSSVQLPIEFESDAETMLVEKALLNCFINPLTAILQVKNGQLIEQNNAFQILKNLYNEIITTFPQYAKTFQFEQVIALCKRTAENTSSMLADRLANRKTEIDTIAGAIIKKAGQNDKQMPVLQTLYMLVKAFEESGEKM